MKHIKYLLPFLMVNIANAAPMTGVDLNGIFFILIVIVGGFVAITIFINSLILASVFKIKSYKLTLIAFFLGQVAFIRLLFYLDDFQLAKNMIVVFVFIEFISFIIKMIFELVNAYQNRDISPTKKEIIQAEKSENLVISFTERPIQNKKKTLKSSFF